MFLKDWNDLEDIKSSFELTDDDLRGVRILLASYESEGYECTAFVLFERDGKLYEVNGFHCSCYGFEGQWTPEETTVAEFRHRLVEGQLGKDWDGSNTFANELSKILDEFSS